MTSAFRSQPKAVWAVAFACVIAFMGIGLVVIIVFSALAGLSDSVEAIVAFRADGRITERWGRLDELAFRQQLGIVPAG